MHWSKRIITAFLLAVLSVVLLFSSVFAFLIVTPLGGKLLVRYFKQEFPCVGLIHIGHYEGSLHDGFVVKDVRIWGMSYIPDVVVLIQEIRVRLPLWDLAHCDFGIFNARIFIPDSDPLVFTGEVYAGQIKGNLYGKSVDLHAASRFWAIEEFKKNLRGSVSNIDMVIRGPWVTPVVSGHFWADNIRYKSILLTDGFSRVHLTLLPDMHQCRMQGEVLFDSGLVNVRRTNLDLAPSQFIFQGDAFNPMMDIHLGSEVQDMAVHLAVKGTLTNPQLIVSSDPPMAPQEALRVLFSGNGWSTSTSPFNGVTSGQLAQDFLNYSLQDIGDQNLGLKTKLTDNLKLGVEMDQLPAPPGETNIYYSRKINGEVDLNENMSLNISQEVLPQDRMPTSSVAGSQDAQAGPETQIYWQYKKRF